VVGEVCQGVVVEVAIREDAPKGGKAEVRVEEEAEEQAESE